MFASTVYLFCGFIHGKSRIPQTVSRWTVFAIKTAYNQALTPCPLGLKARSTRAHAASAALQKGVPLFDICKAATWASGETFVKHYSIDRDTARETPVGTAVLQSLF